MVICIFPLYSWQHQQQELQKLTMIEAAPFNSDDRHVHFRSGTNTPAAFQAKSSPVMGVEEGGEVRSLLQPIKSTVLTH